MTIRCKNEILKGGKGESKPKDNGGKKGGGGKGKEGGKKGKQKINENYVFIIYIFAKIQTHFAYTNTILKVISRNRNTEKVYCCYFWNTIYNFKTFFRDQIICNRKNYPKSTFVIFVIFI